MPTSTRKSRSKSQVNEDDITKRSSSAAGLRKSRKSVSKSKSVSPGQKTPMKMRKTSISKKSTTSKRKSSSKKGLMTPLQALFAPKKAQPTAVKPEKVNVSLNSSPVSRATRATSRSRSSSRKQPKTREQIDESLDKSGLLETVWGKKQEKNEFVAPRGTGRYRTRAVRATKEEHKSRCLKRFEILFFVILIAAVAIAIAYWASPPQMKISMFKYEKWLKKMYSPLQRSLSKWFTKS